MPNKNELAFAQKTREQLINIHIDGERKDKHTHQICIQETFFIKTAIHVLKSQKTNQRHQ